MEGVGRRRTNPQSCCAPCNMHAMMSALLFPPTPTSCERLSCTLSSLTLHPPFPILSLAPSSSFKISLSTFLNTAPTSLLPSDPSIPYTLPSTLLAASGFPALTSHLGVSGMPQSKTTCTAAGNAPKPTIHRHPCTVSENPQPTTYATTCPPVINKLLTTTMRPRNGLGASSEIYSGTTNDALPTAAPTMDRPKIMPHTLVVHDW